MFIFLIRGHETQRPLMKELVAGEPRAFPTSSKFLLRLKKKRSPVNFMTAVSKVFYPKRSKYSNEVWKESHL